MVYFFTDISEKSVKNFVSEPFSFSVQCVFRFDHTKHKCSIATDSCKPWPIQAAGQGASIGPDDPARADGR
jgi:hypothetical protein